MKYEAKARIILPGKTYEAGAVIEDLTKEQVQILKPYLIEIEQPKEEVKAEKPSTKGKVKDKAK